MTLPITGLFSSAPRHPIAQPVPAPGQIPALTGSTKVYEFLDLSLGLPKAGFLAPHAASLHEMKRKSYNDNAKLRVKYFRRKFGLLTLEEFCMYRDVHGQARRVIPRHGATSVGVAR